MSAPQHFYSSRRQSRHLVRRTLSRSVLLARHSRPSRARRACAGCPQSSSSPSQESQPMDHSNMSGMDMDDAKANEAPPFTI